MGMSREYWLASRRFRVRSKSPSDATAAASRAAPHHGPAGLADGRRSAAESRNLSQPDTDFAIAAFAERLNECGDERSILAALEAAMADLGLGAFFYRRFARSEPWYAAVPSATITNFPRAWLARYERQHYWHNDICVRATFTDTEPHIWSEIAAAHPLNPVQLKIAEESVKAGLPDGVNIPIRCGSRFGMMCISRSTAADGLADLKHSLPALVTIANLVHARADEIGIDDRLALANQSALLSPRQREVLQWAAHGKTDWEIAVILRIAEKSVKFHMVGARLKLNASNRAHAVARALSDGLIERV